jgi:hypothetical protein
MGAREWDGVSHLLRIKLSQAMQCNATQRDMPIDFVRTGERSDIKAINALVNKMEARGRITFGA